MKSIVLRTIIAAFVIATVGGVVPVLAQAGDTMTDRHITRIRANCKEALATLSQIHANDAPAYINRNQTYFSISDKLMARLNSRLTLNRYDAAELVKIASNYNETVSEFRDAYKDYDDLMSSVIKMNCTKEPVGFYDRVAKAREAREKVHDLTTELTDYIHQYGDEVQALKDKHFSQTEGTDNE